MSRSSALDALIDWGLRGNLQAHALLSVSERADSSERAVFAMGNINQGEEIFRIPEALLLTASNVFSKRKGPHPDSDDGLAFALLTELREQQRSHRPSFWSPYFATLPTTFSTPLYFNETERARVRGSELVQCTKHV